MITRIFLLLSFITLTFSLLGQASVIKGVVMDKITETPLIGANIIIKQTEVEKGTITDELGNFFMDAIEPGRYTIEISYLGYVTSTIPNILVNSGKETELEILLEEGLNLDEVVVTANKDKANAINDMIGISSKTFSLEEVSRYSGGRNDASRLVSNFAGVSTSNDSRNDIVVRGNSPAGILWRLEGVPIPNPNHFSTLGTTGGPVSALNTNLLKNSDFLTSAFPAEYGNAISGVFDVGFRTGNKEKTEYTAQLAAFSGLEAMAEGPIGTKKDKSFLISYRYSFVQIADWLGLNFGTNATPKYQDLTFNVDLGKSKLGNFKIFGIGAYSDIQFIGKELSEGDFFATKDSDSRATSKFGVIGVKNTYMFSDNTYLRTTLSYSYSGNTFEELRYLDTSYLKSNVYTDVDDQMNRICLHSYINTKFNSALSSRIGITIDNRNLTSSVINREKSTDADGDGLPDLHQVRDVDGTIATYEPYATFKYKFSNKTNMIAGLHGQIQSLHIKFAIEPRVSFSYEINTKSSLNIGYGLHSQVQPLPVFYLLSLDSNGQYRPLNEDLDFTKSHHFVLGWEYKPKEQWRAKIETYYQALFNIPVEKTSSSFSLINAGADFVFPQVGDLINSGKGKNFGVELTIEKFFSRGYYGLLTTSIFQSKYIGSDGIERNTAFNSKYVFNLLSGKEWKIGTNTVLTSDFKFTAAGGRYITPVDLEASKIGNVEVFKTSETYSQKLDPYMRLDLKIGIRLNKKGYSQQFSLDFQNVTNHQNVFSQRYNRVSNSIDTLYQIGFFPDILWRLQF